VGRAAGRLKFAAGGRETAPGTEVCGVAGVALAADAVVGTAKAGEVGATEARGGAVGAMMTGAGGAGVAVGSTRG